MTRTISGLVIEAGPHHHRVAVEPVPATGGDLLDTLRELVGGHTRPIYLREATMYARADDTDLPVNEVATGLTDMLGIGKRRTVHGTVVVLGLPDMTCAETDVPNTVRAHAYTLVGEDA